MTDAPGSGAAASGPAPGRPGALIGVDGGGTRTRVALAEAGGAVLARRDGPPCLVDPRDPGVSAERLVTLVRTAAADAGVTLPAAALCAGLAGAGSPPVRRLLERAVERAGLARRAEVVGDGLIALEGALEGEPGVLLVAGTGSVAYGRGADDRVERAGGRGLILGDEGSGYAIAVAALRACVRAHDGRGARTRLLDELPAAVGVTGADELPGWAGRAEKGAIAALAPRVMRLAEDGDVVAAAILAEAADELALHVQALVRRLGPWTGPISIVFHGGALGEPALATRVEDRLQEWLGEIVVRTPRGDAVAGALARARALAAEASPG